MLLNKSEFKKLYRPYFSPKNRIGQTIKCFGFEGIDHNISVAVSFTDIGIFVINVLGKKHFIKMESITNVDVNENTIFVETEDCEALHVQFIFGKKDYKNTNIAFYYLREKIGQPVPEYLKQDINLPLSKNAITIEALENKIKTPLSNGIDIQTDVSSQPINTANKQPLFNFFNIKKYKNEIQDLKSKLNSIGANDYFQVQNKVSELNHILEQKEAEKRSIIQLIEKLYATKNIESFIDSANKQRDILTKKNEALELEIEKSQHLIETLNDRTAKLQSTIENQKRKIQRSKELYRSMEYCTNLFFDDTTNTIKKLPENDLNELESISPSITLKLHAMDVKDLRKAFKENDQQINKVLEAFSKRYTTKANKAIYQLMVIALRAELQNILYNLKYEKLDISIESVKRTTEKYLKIASDGNQSIINTLVRFIGEIEYLFINAVKIEYNYYVKKEQIRQEQLALRQKMREEAMERQKLIDEQKHIEVEESKFANEINKVTALLSETKDDERIKELNARILELQAQLSNVIVKKEEIIKLQNGKAGYIYVISNLGSFGEDIFKIGMTRRLDPQERVDELGSASVPFKFDVHSFIFSDDAVSLENQLHNILNNNRVNKVNRRKEFFNVSLDKLESIITDIDPTAEFNKTMAAQEYHQSLSSGENYMVDYSIDYFNDDDDNDDVFSDYNKTKSTDEISKDNDILE